MDTAMIGELVSAALGDSSVEVCLGIALPADEARQTIGALAVASGFGADALIEWCSAWADEPSSEDCPPIYYASLLPSPYVELDDLPLGIGATPDAALSDLLWALGAPMLGATLLADDLEPAWLDEPAARLALAQA